MKLKFLATAFAVSFVMIACDSGSSSTDANEPVLSSPDLGVDQLDDEIEKDSSSSGKDSNSSEEVVNKDETLTDTAKTTEKVKINEGSNINLNGIGISPEQYEILKALEVKMGDLDEDGGSASPVVNGECRNGEVQSGVCMGQNVQWTCIYGDWVPTKGFDKVIEAIPPETLDSALEGSDLTKENLLEMLNFLSNMNVDNDDAVAVCEGELTEDFWKLNTTGTFAGTEFLVKGDVTFEGDSMITNQIIEIDWGSESLCEAYLSSDEEDEDDEDEALDRQLYGDVVESNVSCKGSRMVQEEKLVNKSVTDASRASAYEDMIGQCKDYRDGKITFEELMRE